MATEIRTQRIVVADFDRSVEVLPGEVRLEHREDEPGDGSFVSLRAPAQAGEVQAGAAMIGGVDPSLTATLIASAETIPGYASVAVETRRVDGVSVDRESVLEVQLDGGEMPA